MHSATATSDGENKETVEQLLQVSCESAKKQSARAEEDVRMRKSAKEEGWMPFLSFAQRAAEGVLGYRNGQRRKRHAKRMMRMTATPQ